MKLTGSFLTSKGMYVLLRDVTFSTFCSQLTTTTVIRVTALGAYYQGAGGSLLWLSCFGKRLGLKWNLKLVTWCWRVMSYEIYPSLYEQNKLFSSRQLPFKRFLISYCWRTIFDKTLISKSLASSPQNLHDLIIKNSLTSLNKHFAESEL